MKVLPRTIDIPENIRNLLMAQYHTYAPEEDGFAIHDLRLNTYLCETLGLHTDSPRFQINQSFVVWFDWSIQVWRIK